MPVNTATQIPFNARINDRSRSLARVAGFPVRCWACFAIAIGLHAGVFLTASSLFQESYRYHPHHSSTRISLSVPVGVTGPVQRKVEKTQGGVPSAAAKQNDPNPIPIKPHGSDVADEPLASNAAPADYYFTSDEVSQRAYPLRAFRLSSNCLEDAKVRLKLWVNENGNVDRIESLQSNLDEVCERIAESAFRLTPFAPAKRGEDAVKSIWLVELSPKDDAVQ